MIAAGLIAVSMILPMAWGVSPPVASPPNSLPPAAKSGEAPRLPLPDFAKFTAHKVLKADGLTITIGTGSGVETVALLGIEPPRPSDPTTPLAERFLTNLLVGENVYLVDHEAGRRQDEKKRRIVYVHRAPDGLLANAELVRQGYAREQAEVPYQYQDAMRAFEGLARAARKGLWTEPATSRPGTKLAEPKPVDAKPTETSPDGKLIEPAPADLDAKPGVPVGPAPAPGAEPIGVTPDKKSEKGSRSGVTVYASKSGTKYHTQTCRYLGKTKDPISVDEAKKRNLTPCNECKPGV